MICKADEAVRGPVFCKNWETYNICSQLGTVAEVTSWNDNAEFKDMHAAYLLLGFSEKQRTELYMLFSFCLQLGNVDFEDNDAGEGSVITTPEQLELSAEMVQVKTELQRLTRALLATRRSAMGTETQVAALAQPWVGHAGEVRCAAGHRCADYINAGEDQLAATYSVGACKAYCNATYPEVPFFAFHSEQGMVQFMNDPKGRCRCYDATPCNLIPDSGYTLWSTTAKCSSIVGGGAVE